MRISSLCFTISPADVKFHCDNILAYVKLLSSVLSNEKDTQQFNSLNFINKNEMKKRRI